MTTPGCAPWWSPAASRAEQGSGGSRILIRELLVQVHAVVQDAENLDRVVCLSIDDDMSSSGDTAIAATDFVARPTKARFPPELEKPRTNLA